MWIDWLHQWDEILTLALNHLHGPFSDACMMLLSRKQVWFPLYGVVAFFLFRRLGWRKALIVILSVALTTVACDQTSNLIKDWVGRLRPCYNFNMISGGLHMLEGRGNYFGFFSAHAANSFGFAMSTLMGFRNDTRYRYRHYAFLIMTWAALVSISRVFVGKHFIGDILVGTLIGLGYGALFGYIARRIIMKGLPSPSLSRGTL